MDRRRIQKSASSGRNNNNAGGGKAPRTVHIDVYCTGSDEDSLSSMEDSSSEDDHLGSYKRSSQRHSGFDNASVSTNPTVYESFDMKLKHRRASREELPRKFIIDNGVRRTPSVPNMPKRGRRRRVVGIFRTY